MKFGVYSSYILVVPRIYYVAAVNPRYNTTVKKILPAATIWGDCCISRRRKLGAYIKYEMIGTTSEITEYKKAQHPHISLRSKLKEGCKKVIQVIERLERTDRPYILRL